jgi:hypothetical protein
MSFTESSQVQDRVNAVLLQKGSHEIRCIDPGFGQQVLELVDNDNYAIGPMKVILNLVGDSQTKEEIWSRCRNEGLWSESQKIH